MADFETKMPAINHGGKREGAGRPPGSLNKNTAPVREMASEYNEAAVQTLAFLMLQGETHQVRLAASIALLDRSTGRPRAVDVNEKKYIAVVNR